jgi:hypothetical protein
VCKIIQLKRCNQPTLQNWLHSVVSYRSFAGRPW